MVVLWEQSWLIGRTWQIRVLSIRILWDLLVEAWDFLALESGGVIGDLTEMFVS